MSPVKPEIKSFQDSYRGREKVVFTCMFIHSFFHLFTHFDNDPREQNGQKPSALAKLTYCFYVLEQIQTLLILSAEPFSLLSYRLRAGLHHLLLYYCDNFPRISLP